MGSIAPTSLRRDFLRILVNPASDMPKGTHGAALKDVVNLVEAHRPSHPGAAQLCRVESDMSDSDTDLDADMYRDAVAALYSHTSSVTRCSKTRKRRSQSLARGGPTKTPRCAPRSRKRGRQVEADAPVVG